MKFFIDVLISCDALLWTETQRGIQKGSRGRSQVLSWNKNKTRARIVFSRPRSLKVYSECGKASYNSFCRNYVRVLVSQDRDKEDDIMSVSDI